MRKVYKPPSINAERNHDLSLTPRKRKFKADLAEKKQQLSKSRKLLLEKSKDLENMKKPARNQAGFCGIAGKRKGKRAFTKPKSDC